MAGHLSCLAPSFSGVAENLVPTTGDCPGCGAKLRWIDLVKELSLRMRGEAEVQKIFKIRKPRGTKKGDAAVAAIPLAEDGSEDEEMADDDVPYLSISADSEIDDAEPAAKSHAMTRHVEFRAPKRAPAPNLFIEDSDWDDAEIVT
jgi:structure-specific endonuclease subunit SLX1